jgi:hypothetical protein
MRGKRNADFILYIFKVYYSIAQRNPDIYEFFLPVPDINITVPASED